MEAHEIRARALQLPRDQRAALAQRLVSSLDPADDIEQKWADEAARRSGAVTSGEEKATPAADVFAEVRRRTG